MFYEITVTQFSKMLTNLSHILDKLHLANRVQATLYALRTGLTSLEDEAMAGE